MSESGPSKSKSPTAGKEPARSQAPPAETGRRQILVRFYRRMRMRRIYPLVVSLQQKNTTSGGTFAVRPLIPGALVTPAELLLDPAKPGTHATFYLTPLARGRLPRARVQLHRQGSLLQEIALPMKAVTQRLTWILLALTILVPAFLLYTTKYNPLTGTVPREMHPAGDDKKKDTVAGLLGKLVAGKEASVAQGPVIKEMPAPPGEILEYKLRKNLKEDLPPIPSVDVADYVARALGNGYRLACEMAADHFSFYIGALLLALTIVSAITHSGRRARRRGSPLELPTGSSQA